ncbi:MAG: hypothetical protein GC160_02060 [Acidobacteria bacterium]|nr:hypothetical protein [Acidobacteriota bacterium]
MSRTAIVLGSLLALGAAGFLADRIALSGVGAHSEKTGHFEIRYGAVSPEEVRSLAESLEEGYERIGRDLGTAPPATIRVTLYDSRWAYARSTGHWGASGNVEGPEVLHVLWEGDRTAANAVHELAHAITLQLLIDQEPQPFDAAAFDRKFSTLPVWLWEAVACYEAGQSQDALSLPYMQDGRYPSLAELSDRGKGQKIYAVGSSILSFLRASWGENVTVRLLTSYGDLPATLGVSDEEFAARWNEWLRSGSTKP